jgi:hypothetical protein
MDIHHTEQSNVVVASFAQIDHAKLHRLPFGIVDTLKHNTNNISTCIGQGNSSALWQQQP